MPFNLKHTSTELAQEPGRKRNALTSISNAQVGKKTKAGSVMDRLHVCIFRVTDCAADMWRRFEGTVVPLWQVQFYYDGKPNLLYKLAGSFVEFLSDVGAKLNPKASNMEDVLQYYNAKLIESDQSDSDQVGFVPC